MKNHRRSLYRFFAEHSFVLFASLIMLTIGIFISFFFMNAARTSLVTKVRFSHHLAVLSERVSNESYHAQMDFWRYADQPSSKRKLDFIQQKNLSLASFENLEQTIVSNPEFVSQAMVKKVAGMKSQLLQVDDCMQAFLKKLDAHASPNELRAAADLVETQFNELNWDQSMKQVVADQIGSYQQLEGATTKLGFTHNILLAIGFLLLSVLVFGVTILHRSVMQGKGHELQLVQSSKLASLGELSAGVAHELNNPLMFVQGFSGRIRAQIKKQNFDGSTPILDYLHEIDDAVARMHNIVQHLRDFSRVSSHDFKPVSINEVVKRSFVLLSEQLRVHNIEIEKELSNLNPTVLGNSNRLEQVFLNLTTNAKDALMGKTCEGKKIKVKTEVVQNEVVITFGDNGSGIEKKNLSRVFDPFFTTKPLGQGTGLGLSVSQGILGDHEGSISVASNPGTGTVFTLVLPRFILT